jgi:hypothetical protein
VRNRGTEKAVHILIFVSGSDVSSTSTWLHGSILTYLEHQRLRKTDGPPRGGKVTFQRDKLPPPPFIQGLLNNSVVLYNGHYIIVSPFFPLSPSTLSPPPMPHVILMHMYQHHSSIRKSRRKAGVIGSGYIGVDQSL